MANEDNFYRTYTMEVGKRGKKGIVIGNTDSSTQDTLHISFAIEKADTDSTNTAKVQVWNLSEESLKVIEQKDPVMYLKAGYNMNDALILAGDITAVTTSRDGADTVTEIEVADGMVALRDTYLQISKRGKVKSKTVYSQIAKKMGCTIKYAKGLKFKTIPNGFSYVGKAKNALTKLSKMCDHKWSIQNGVLQITKKGKPISTEGYLLSDETGLISIPQKITITSSTSSSSSSDSAEISGWEVDYMMNGAINIADTVKVKTNTVNGYFYVNKVTISGDNYSGDWSCKAELIEMKK